MNFEVEEYGDGLYDGIFIWKYGKKYMALYVRNNEVAVGNVEGTDTDSEETILKCASKSEIRENSEMIWEAMRRFVNNKKGIYGSFIFNFGNIMN